jgi:hypothetical protein
MEIPSGKVVNIKSFAATSTMEIMSASEGKIANTSMRKAKNAISLKTAKSIYANLNILASGPGLPTRRSNNHRKL